MMFLYLVAFIDADPTPEEFFLEVLHTYAFESKNRANLGVYEILL